ncbi:hypothetical protein CR513_50773, partial [Mucuna pruriens]
MASIRLFLYLNIKICNLDEEFYMSNNLTLLFRGFRLSLSQLENDSCGKLFDNLTRFVVKQIILYSSNAHL